MQEQADVIWNHETAHLRGIITGEAEHSMTIKLSGDNAQSRRRD